MLASAILAFVWYRVARRLAGRICNSLPYDRLDPDRVAFIRSPFDEASGVIGVANALSWAISRLTAGPFELFARFDRLEPGRSRLRMALGYLALAAGGVLLVILPEQVPELSAALDGEVWIGTVYAPLAILALVVGVAGLTLTLLA